MAVAPRMIREATSIELTELLDGLSWAKEWPQPLRDLIALHSEITLPKAPSARSISHQIIAIFAANLGIGFNRQQLTLIGERLGRTEGDSIQWANKIERQGIKLDKTPVKTPGYGFYDLTFSDRYLTSSQDLTTDDGRKKSEAKNRRYFELLSKGAFEKGHRDPNLPLADGNLVMQPQEINRSYRDRYIFDENGLPKAPNPFRLIEDPSAYYGNRSYIELVAQGLAAWLEANPELAVAETGDMDSEPKES